MFVFNSFLSYIKLWRQRLSILKRKQILTRAKRKYKTVRVYVEWRIEIAYDRQ